MRFGIDRLIDDNFAPLQGKRVGLFSNLSAVNRDLTTTYDVFRTSDAVNLTALYGPEHGFGGHALDGVKVDNQIDVRSGVPIFSLYGETRQPTADMLTDIDIMVCDIQDIGARFYTFMWSVTHILEACGEHNIPVLLLDRPNPIGARIDGGTLEPSLSTFVGRYPIPVQHGLTLGEIAQLFNAEWNSHPAELNVYTCDGWSPHQRWQDIRRPFVAPSPAMAHPVTAYHYPGSCLIEGTTLSEGRGTSLPFEVVGAPYIDSWQLADALNALKLDGVRFRVHEFTPNASKHKGVLCGGVQAHIIDVESYRPVLVWLHVIHTIRHLYRGDDFTWLPPYDDIQHFDRLIGDYRTRQLIDQGAPVAEITADWGAFHASFRELSAPYLLYDR